MDIKQEQRQPWVIAKEEGKTVILKIIGPMIGVYYPWRKSGDMYVALDNEPVHCCQCDQDFPIIDFLAHVQKHNKAPRKYPDVIIDHRLVKPEENVGKYCLS